MNYLSIENIAKSFGERVLFTDISFGINKDQKIAFIAKNGTGKTSMLNIITGKDTPDSGQVVSRNGIRISFLSQEPDLDPNLTIEGFPGKTFDYLSMNKIILCFANENSAVARFIERYKVGINIDPKNINNLGDVIEKLNSAHFIEESLNNVAILNKNEINKEKVIDKYLSLI